MRLFSQLILLHTILIGASTTLAAPLGTGFTYQGRINLQDIPVNGTVNLRFTLWDAVTGGNRIGNPEIQSNVPVASGSFVVLLNNTGQFGPNAFNGEARWLHVQVCSDPGCSTLTTLNPRQSITGTPYALGPWIRSASGHLSYMTGNIGIGTASPAQPLVIANGRMRFSSNLGDIEFTETADLIAHATTANPDGALPAFRVDTGTFLRRCFTVLNNGNVGIGTSSPSASLDVRGAAQISSQLQVGGFGNIYTIFTANGIGFSSGGYDAGISFVYPAGGLLMSSRLRVSSNYFTGMGTYPFEVGDTFTNGNGNGAHVTTTGIWTNASSRKLKTDFREIDKKVILDRVAALPIREWRYNGENKSVKHIGPVAEDFQAAFGLGGEDKYIGTVDADGIALAAIQGLYQANQEKDGKIVDLEARLARLEALFHPDKQQSSALTGQAE